MCFIIVALLAGCRSFAQTSDTASLFSVSGYVDAYYAFYGDSVGAGKFQKFTSTSPRSNSISLNAAMISAKYYGPKVRGKIALNFGDIAATAWAPGQFNKVTEAYVGFKIIKGLWIDGGLFRAHLGTEYFLPGENLVSSMAVATFYDPYYQSGIRATYTGVRNLEVSGFLLNGYNMFVDNNNKKSGGLAATYILDEESTTLVGYSGYFGDDTPLPADTISHFRFHNNVFIGMNTGKTMILIGGDYCLQQNADIATGTRTVAMYSAMVTLKRQLRKKFAVYLRSELFHDPEGFMSTVITDNAGRKTGYKLLGHTGGFEYKPTRDSYIRIEGRTIYMDKDQYIFRYKGAWQNTRPEVMLNAGVTFDLLRRVLS